MTTREARELVNGDILEAIDTDGIGRYLNKGEFYTFVKYIPEAERIFVKEANTDSGGFFTSRFKKRSCSKFEQLTFGIE